MFYLFTATHDVWASLTAASASALPAADDWPNNCSATASGGFRESKRENAKGFYST